MTHDTDDKKTLSLATDTVLMKIEKYLLDFGITLIALFKLVIQLLVTCFLYIFQTKKFNLYIESGVTPKPKILRPLSAYLGSVCLILFINLIYLTKIDINNKPKDANLIHDFMDIPIIHKGTEFFKGAEFEKTLFTLVPVLIFALLFAVISKLFSRKPISLPSALPPICYFASANLIALFGVIFSFYIFEVFFHLNTAVTYGAVFQGEFLEAYPATPQNPHDSNIALYTQICFILNFLFTLVKSPFILIRSLHRVLERNYLITVLILILSFSASLLCTAICYKCLSLLV